MLQRMWESLDRTLDQGRAAAHVDKIGLGTAFELERNDIHTKARKPFDNRLEADT